MANTDFTARCMAGKALDDVAGKQDVIADLDTIRAGAAAGATAVQPAALDDYQPKIDSTHKLDADFVDDTNSANKFATQSQLDQIGINENNISSLYKVGSANILKNTAQTQVLGGVTFTMNADGSITANGTKNNNDWLYLSTGNSLKAGTYVLSSGGITGSDKIVVVATADSLGSAIMTTSTATGVFERELTQDYSGLYYAIRIANGTVCDNLLFKPMLCEKSVYEAINGEFQPYAMSNAEITAWILAHS